MIEILAVITIIGILATIVFSNFDDARKSARDSIRTAELQQLQVALELYKAQYGFYPAEGCNGIVEGDTPSTSDWNGSGVLIVEWTGPGETISSWGDEADNCDEYIAGMVPEFIAELPIDPKDEFEIDKGFYYRTDAGGSAYKLLILDTVEVDMVTSYSHPFARCPGINPDTSANPLMCQIEDGTPPRQERVYGIYSTGAKYW
jgi:type II secretory pathway pseudopilin PulG